MIQSANFGDLDWLLVNQRNYINIKIRLPILQF